MIKFNKDGTIFATCGNDKKINVMNAMNFQRLGSMECPESVKSFEITKDTEYIVSGGFIGSINLWRLSDGKKMGEITFDMKIKCVELSYGDEYVLFSGERFEDHNISAVHIFRFDDFVQKMLNGEKILETQALYTKDFPKVFFSRMKFGL